MGAFDNIIRNRLERIRLQTIADQKAKGITASGKSARTMETEVKNNVGTLTGEAYFEQQIFSRDRTRKGHEPGTPYLSESIREWLDVKSWSRRFDEKKKNSLAFAIANKIHERGTLRGSTTEYPGLEFTEISEVELAILRQEIGDEAAIIIGTDIQKIWSKLNNGTKRS